ncbi:MAG: sensor histidine kinase, partial [Proteobacteria bacterium]|nr:sensor histidine kinase [Pseudomonadota bacterium]
ETLRRELDVRAPSDLAPLDTTQVPSELRSLVDAFNRMLGRLDSAIEGMRRFTADASHQMRTPLAILRTHVGLLRSTRPGSTSAKAAIDDIDEASRRLGHLLIQLLALARADAAGPQALELGEIDLNAIAASVAADTAAVAVETGIELHFEDAGGAAVARGHVELARELLANLMDNAVRYNRPGGLVSVTVDGAIVVIEDDGPGIAPADRERVFNRFTRLGRSVDAPGSGLGMSIALSLARAIGATIELLTPASGTGLRVVVRFAAL